MSLTKTIALSLTKSHTTVSRCLSLSHAIFRCLSLSLAVSRLWRVELRTVCVVMCLYIHKTGLTLVWNTIPRQSRSPTVSRPYSLSRLLSIVITVFRQCDVHHCVLCGMMATVASLSSDSLCMHKTGWTCQDAMRPLRNLATTGRFQQARPSLRALWDDEQSQTFLQTVYVYIRQVGPFRTRRDLCRIS